MSIESVNLLVDLGLLRRNAGGGLSVTDFPADDDEILKKLTYYRKAVVNLMESRLRSRTETSAEWNIFRSSISADQGLQACLLNSFVADRCIIDDPVARACPDEVNEVAEGLSLMLKVGQVGAVDRIGLGEALGFVVSISPLVEAGLICFYAFSASRRQPFSGAVRYDPKLFDHEVPESLKSIVSSRTRLLHGARMEDGGTALFLPSEGEQSRIIGIFFEGDLKCGPESMSMYYLSEMKVLEFDEAKGTFTFEQRFDEAEAIDPDRYQNWITQSVNQTIGHRLRAVAAEIAVAHLLGARYVTESEFEASVCLCDVGRNDNAASSINFVNAVSEKLIINDAAHILKVRERYRSSWNGFRDGLVSMAMEANSDPAKAAKIMANHVQPKLEELTKACEATRSHGLQGFGLAAISLYAVVLGGASVPFLPAAGVLAAGGLFGAFPKYKEYRRLSKGADIIWSKIVK